MSKEPGIHLTQWDSIIFNRSLMNIGDGANRALLSKKLYGKFKHDNGHWVYWTKINIEDLPEKHKKHFIEKKEI